jgi:putative transposase
MRLKRRRPQPGDKWYMDEVFIRIRGKQHYLWRAVDLDGNVLDILVHSRLSTAAATRFFRKLLKGLGVCSAGDRHRQAQELRRRQT